MGYVDLRPYKPRTKRSKTEAPAERPKTSFRQEDAGYVIFGEDGTSTMSAGSASESSSGRSIVPDPPSAFTGTQEASAGDFFSSFAEVGKQEGSIAVEKKDTIELLNILHDKIRGMEEQLHRIERKLEGREGRKYFGGE
ncbi:MAG TPA: hypothetical protein HA282_02585 [Nanoarchaeota archaeon]|nr:hypothetical protein [Nanoarchaeota archaeon]HIH34197.1 hypothetical protein [Nanoarchaeota archaeon]HIH51427.1 hypothetical protein [Nanoarchaeota archaeon]HIH66079.1 hypothetical protein [Nanoarchaeota archaeon]